MMLKLYFITLPILLGIDFLWLSVVAKGFYSDKIGYLMKPEISYLPAILFYILFAFALVFFVINPVMISGGGLLKVFLIGAFFGLTAYAAYDLTNQAIVRDWPMIVTIVDMLWGAILSGLTSLISFFVFKKLGL